MGSEDGINQTKVFWSVKGKKKMILTNHNRNWKSTENFTQYLQVGSRNLKTQHSMKEMGMEEMNENIINAMTETKK